MVELQGGLVKRFTSRRGCESSDSMQIGYPVVLVRLRLLHEGLYSFVPSATVMLWFGFRTDVCVFTLFFAMWSEQPESTTYESHSSVSAFSAVACVSAASVASFVALNFAPPCCVVLSGCASVCC
jgi:hypothetical protein